MFLKEQGNTIALRKLEALDSRLPLIHPKKSIVQKDYKNKRSGVRGEKEVDYPLSFLDEQKYLILHNLRLPDKHGFFQIDTLILSEKCILLLEVKNWYGTLLFDESGQVIRIGDDQKEEGFPNPIPQAKTQLHRLQKWLQTHNISTIPVEYLVVISFPSTIIKSTSPTENFVPKEVIHNNQLFFKISEVMNKFSAPVITMNKLTNIADLLIATHKPETGDILAKYKINKDELIKGVICPNCATPPMIKKKRKWLCKSCFHSSVDAYISALNDYKLLIGDRITNQEARDFLQIKSTDAMKRLLQKHFSYVGNTKDRVYIL